MDLATKAHHHPAREPRFAAGTNFIASSLLITTAVAAIGFRLSPAMRSVPRAIATGSGSARFSLSIHINHPHIRPDPGFDLHSPISLTASRANIHARISHLAESDSAALEHAHAAPGDAAGRQRAAKELLRCEIPERQSLEGHQYRTHRRREFIQASPDESSSEMRPRRSRPTTCWVGAECNAFGRLTPSDCGYEQED